MRIAFLLAVLLLPAGCGLNSDPMKQPGTWEPTGANDINLRAMVADPADLGGRITSASTPAALPVRAIDNMNADKAKPLYAPETTSAYGSGGGGGGASATQ